MKLPNFPHITLTWKAWQDLSKRSFKLCFIVNMIVIFLYDQMLVKHETSPYKNSLEKKITFINQFSNHNT